VRKSSLILKQFLPFAFLATVTCGLVYLSIQQNIREGANDSQIQIAEDTGAKLALSQTPQINFDEKVDPSVSLAPFVITYDEGGKVIDSNAQINGETPTIPKGVLDFAKTKGEDRFTWQTKEGVRIAAVVSYYKGVTPGFVLAGRSLREVEVREDQLMWEVFSLWIFSLAGLLFLNILLNSRN